MYDERPPDSESDPDSDVANVLIVDDDANNLLALEVALEGVICRQVQARSGEDALRELLRREFAVIVLDVQMPGMDGFETATLIRSRVKNRHVPIIFVTAFSQDDSDMRRGYELGAVDYLFKPIVGPVIRAKVEALIDLRARTQEVKQQARRLREMERGEVENRLNEARRKWEAEALRVQNQHLEQVAQRKDEFIAMLAHELRNPLAPIVNGLQVMTLIGLKDPELQRAHRIMDRQTRHLTRLVDDLLDVSRISKGKLELQREPLDLCEVARQAVEACEDRILAMDQTLHFVAPEEGIFVHGDRVRLVQVVVNLLTNATRYSEKGTEIVVELRAAATQASLSVRDQGRGIAPEAQKQIFDKFVQERQGGRGLGLGLTLVRQLVELHGGQVGVNSDGVGKGSDFTVVLPRGECVQMSMQTHTEGTHAAAAPAQPSAQVRSLRIAVVEDDPDIRETLAWVLVGWGHRVELAVDGPSGVELITRIRPDVALLDLGLPGLDGHGVAEAICKQMGDGRPKLFALSGYGQARDKKRSKEAGFDIHLVKPVDPDLLRRTLESLD